MKSRPRHAENRCAEELANATQAYGIDFDFIRIPVIGRIGPDVTFPNPLNLAVDVKTRIEVPKKLFHPFDTWKHYCTPLYSITQIKNLPYVWMGVGKTIAWNSVLVEDWLRHMSIWAKSHDAIPALLLHRPHMDYQDSAIVIWRQDIRPLRVNAEIARLEALPGAYRRVDDQFGGYDG